MLCSHDLRRVLIAFAYSINFAFRASFMREFVTNLKEGAVNASLGPWSQLSMYTYWLEALSHITTLCDVVRVQITSTRTFRCS